MINHFPFPAFSLDVLAACHSALFLRHFRCNHYEKLHHSNERRFDISSSTVGLIDGSFEIGKFYMHFDYLVIRIAGVKTVHICSPPLILNQR